ncbi:hypothetical protein ABPG77_001882 [Micractinium sp. CCAP 211/92]
MSATLKDLAPAEKEKVARLICQVVEKETQLRELEEKAAFSDGMSAGAGAAKAEQLTEQNAQLARENTSLRAKLTHAFDVLRAYQHKCRLLDATAQVAEVATSRPTTPAWTAAAAGTLHATKLALVGASSASGDDLADTILGEAGRARGLERSLAAAALLPAQSRQLSPVAEAPWESQHPQAAQACEFLHPSNPCRTSSIGLAPPQAVLPQLETLQLMAQALLEAQANILAKQAAADEQQPYQQQQRQAQQQEELPQPQMSRQQEQPCSAAPTAAEGQQSVAAASPGPSEPSATAPALPARPGPQSGCFSSDVHSSAAVFSRCGSAVSSRSAPDHAGPAAPDRAALVAVQPAQAHQHHWLPRACSTRAFDGSLTDLVNDVEVLLQLETSSSWCGSLGESAGSAWTSAGSVHLGTAACGRSGTPVSQVYEENDVLDLIMQL